MKILILGNSNSILKDGWSFFFKQLVLKESNIDFEFLNFSIGGSPSPALLCQCLLNEEKLLSVDYVIIEPTVIDHGEEWQNPQDIFTHAMCLLSFFSEKSIKALLFLLPRNAHAAINTTKGMIAWGKAAKVFCCPILNGSEIISKFSDLHKVPLEMCWRDSKGHPTAYCQEYLAEHVFSNFKNATVPKHDIFNFNNRFKVIKADALAAKSDSIELIEQSTQLMTVNWLKLKAGSRIRVNIPDHLQIHGLLINYGEMNPTKKTVLEFESSSHEQLVDISNSFLPKEPSGKLSVLYRSIRGIIGCKIISVPSIDSNIRFMEDCPESIGIVS